MSLSLAISSPNAIALLFIAIAVFMLIRQIYRLATGKVTKCSCCSPICSTGDKEDEQSPSGDEEQNPSEENDEKSEQEDK